MKNKIGIYLDLKKVGNWDWQSFLNGDVGMSGTDGQSLLLVNDLSEFYDVYLFSNTDIKEYKGIRATKVTDAEEAAALARQLELKVLILNDHSDEATIKAINKLEELKQPFILWDHNGPTASFETILAGTHSLKRIVCVSKAQANWHRHRRFFSKVTYIYNGQDYPLKNIKEKKSAHNIGYLGAVSESKGFHWVAKAWPQIKQAFPDATLTVIGSIKTHNKNSQTGEFGIAIPEFEDKYIKPYLGNTLDEINKNGVNFTGHISPNEMPSYMDKLDLGVVNPNMDGSNETFCVSAIDFQANGVPVIGASAGGLTETVNNGKTGILINDSNKLADAVIKLLNDKEKLLFLSRNGNNWVRQNFSRAGICERWRNLIEDVIDDKENEGVNFNLSDISVKLLAKEAIRIKNKFTRLK